MNMDEPQETQLSKIVQRDSQIQNDLPLCGALSMW